MGQVESCSGVHEAQGEDARLFGPRGAPLHQVHGGRLRKRQLHVFLPLYPLSTRISGSDITLNANRDPPFSVTPSTEVSPSSSSRPLSTANRSSISRNGSVWVTSWRMRILVCPVGSGDAGFWGRKKREQKQRYANHLVVSSDDRQALKRLTENMRQGSHAESEEPRLSGKGKRFAARAESNIDDRTATPCDGRGRRANQPATESTAPPMDDDDDGGKRVMLNSSWPPHFGRQLDLAL